MDKLDNPKFEPLYYVNYCLFIFIMLSTVGCAQGFPELNPSKEASTAPGKEWKPHTEEYSDFFPTEELAGVPSELREVINELTLSQLVDVALVNNPTTLQAWEHAKTAAAAWAVARGIYYPQIGGSAAYAYAKSGGSTQGLDQFKEQYGQAGATLNYLLLGFGGRSAQSEAARQAPGPVVTVSEVTQETIPIYLNYVGNTPSVSSVDISGIRRHDCFNFPQLDCSPRFLRTNREVRGATA